MKGKERIYEKGITLIALVITIIVLLILAGVTINIVINQGIMDKSQTAVDEYKISQYKDNIEIIKTGEHLKKIANKLSESLKDLVVEKLESKENETWVKTVKTSEDDAGLEENQIKVLTQDNYIIIAEIEEKKEYNIGGDKNISPTGGKYRYYNPVIPSGFKTLETEDASWNVVYDSAIGDYVVDGWNNGLVIQDGSGNQFVWVPVDGTNVPYAKWCTKGNSYNYCSDDTTLPSRVKSEDTQIAEYEGFYIARYEAGIPESMKEAISSRASRNVAGKPVSKKNQIPWNCIDYTTAKANAEIMYTFANTNYHVQSGLVTGTQWDTVMKWFKNSGIDVENSEGWGNYVYDRVPMITEYSKDYGVTWIIESVGITKGTSTGWLLKTGNTDYTSRKNIYDLAGNLKEITSEFVRTSYYSIRGGSYGLGGDSYPASKREETATRSDYNGFRCVLYINEGLAKEQEINNINGSTNTKLGNTSYSYKNPVIPVGFKTVNTQEARWATTDGNIVDDWNDGLVIEDGEGNQFVWVPVDGTNVPYAKWCTKGNSYNYCSDDTTLPSGVTSENKQITEYGGFYIARYEAGIPENMKDAISSRKSRNVSGVPVSKKNQVPWNCIDYTVAKANAEIMYTFANTNNHVQSGLVTGTQWDTVMKWFKNSEIDVENSKGWGNYSYDNVPMITEYSKDYGDTWITESIGITKSSSTGWLLKTGNTDYTSRKNIYDLAGNLREITSEFARTSYYSIRGGAYEWGGDSYPASRREETATRSEYNGFRCVLYIQ